MITKAIQFPIDGVFSMEDLIDDVINFYEHGYPKGAKAGLFDFDDHISFLPGQLTTVTGIPGSGKSEFIDYLMVQLSRNHKWPFGILSFENQPASLHATKIMEKIAGKSFQERDILDLRMTREEMEHAIVFTDKYFHFINIAQSDVTI